MNPTHNFMPISGVRIGISSVLGGWLAVSFKKFNSLRDYNIKMAPLRGEKRKHHGLVEQRKSDLNEWNLNETTDNVNTGKLHLKFNVFMYCVRNLRRYIFGSVPHENFSHSSLMFIKIMRYYKYECIFGRQFWK